jgi:hypothetical protein
MIRWVAVIAALLVYAPGLAGQGREVRSLRFRHDDEIVRGRGFAVVADRRIFAMTAFMNAAGYDTEADGVEMHPARIQVRDAIARNLERAGEKLATWRSLYAEQALPDWVYFDYALSLSGDYPFERIRPDEEVTYRQVLETMDAMLPALNDFWVSADLEAVWAGVKPMYTEELARYDFEAMETQMQALWSYLRLPRADTYTIVNVPNLIAQHFVGIGAEYDGLYYTMETPGASGYRLNTHEYLHSIVNEVSRSAFPGAQAKLTRYFEAGRTGALAASYQHAPTFVSECLVRALDYRLRLSELQALGSPVDRVLARVNELSEGGLTLVKPFFEGLAGFEASTDDFAAYVPVLFEGVSDPVVSGGGGR